MVLEDVTEFDFTGGQTKLPKILLNGNNICMVWFRIHKIAFNPTDNHHSLYLEERVPLKGKLPTMEIKSRKSPQREP